MWYVEGDSNIQLASSYCTSQEDVWLSGPKYLSDQTIE